MGDRRLEPVGGQRVVTGVGVESAGDEHESLGRLVVDPQLSGQAAGEGPPVDHVDQVCLDPTGLESVAPGLEAGLGAVADWSGRRSLEYDHWLLRRSRLEGGDRECRILRQHQTRMCLKMSRSWPRVNATPGRFVT